MVNFWERRIRRIMPALSVVVTAALAAGWLFYLPDDFAFLGKSLISQAVMAANIFFWRSGTHYFDHGTENKSLLHTWSLAVEEQFYLIFPLLLVFLLRSQPRSWRRWILGIAIVSLAISVMGCYLPQYERLSFYMLPSRAWELLVGALAAAGSKRLTASKLVGESSGFFGLALIVWSVFFYTDSTRFPGLGALPPCIGTALIIASSDAKVSIVGRLLSFRPFVFVGLISYPLYLWHWPLLIWAKYLTGYELSTATRIELLLASFLLAVLSWKFVETPFRQRRWLGERSQIFKFAGFTLGMFFAMGIAVYTCKGFPARFSAQALAFASAQNSQGFQDQIDLERARAGRFTKLGSSSSSQPIHVLLWGDSHAKSIAPALDTLCKEHSQRGVMSAYGATAPVLNFISTNPGSLRERSPKVAELVVAFVAAQHIKNVVITARWNTYPDSAEFKDNLIHTVRTLMNSGAHVYVLKDVPNCGFNVPRITALNALRGIDLEALGTTKEQHQKSEAALEPTFEKLAELGATVMDPSDLFLTSRGSYRIIKDGELLYVDSNHLSLKGAALLVPLFRPLFQPP
jgi:peptidoglycan/LPS O-acetylase OafA/YrhL